MCMKVQNELELSAQCRVVGSPKKLLLLQFQQLIVAVFSHYWLQLWCLKQPHKGCLRLEVSEFNFSFKTLVLCIEEKYLREKEKLFLVF